MAHHPTLFGALHTGSAFLVALLAGCFSSYTLDTSHDAGVDDAGRDVRFDAPDFGLDTFEPPPEPPPTRARTSRCTLGEPLPPFGTPDACDLSGTGDADGDGYANDEDCNDCSALINPGAMEVGDNDIDEDCDGSLTPLRCSDPIAQGVNAERAASALGLCSGRDGAPGTVTSARFITLNGSDPDTLSSSAILADLGPANLPIDGSRMLSLSTGRPDASATNHCSGAAATSGDGFLPFEYSIQNSGCGSSSLVYDSIVLELTLRVPTNARAYGFASNFFTREYPDFVCEPFNDVFAVFEEREGRWENVVFDERGNTVTVNNAFLEACSAGVVAGLEYTCALGVEPLVGSGFDLDCRGGATGPGGATGWICTEVDVEAGEMLRLRFAVWDAADPLYTSLALIDNFRWVWADYE